MKRIFLAIVICLAASMPCFALSEEGDSISSGNSCVDVQFVFARGSGATRNESDE